nr:MATE family efflux transporter [Clostridium grantii]
MVGNAIGAGEQELAYSYGRKILKLSFIVSAVISIIIIALNPYIGMIFKMPITVVFTLITVQEIYKFISCAKRFKSKKWINNLIKLEGVVE